MYFAIGFLILFCQAWFRSNDDEVKKYYWEVLLRSTTKTPFGDVQYRPR
jgi:hypothetical protein